MSKSMSSELIQEILKLDAFKDMHSCNMNQQRVVNLNWQSIILAFVCAVREEKLIL